MDKLTVLILSEQTDMVHRLYDCLLNNESTGLRKSKVEMDAGNQIAQIRITSLKQLHKYTEKTSDWLEALCDQVADFIIRDKEEEVVKKFLGQDRSLRDNREILMGYCRQLLNGDNEMEPQALESHGIMRRTKLLSQDLQTYLTDASMLNLDGFLRFRIPKYGAELKEIIEYATDEYLMDQQYKEFISLLRYFVYIQDCKIPEAHLMHKGGHEFALLSGDMRPIDTDNLDTSFKVEFLDKDYSFEDMIVSTLITIAPQRIVIHTREANLQIIKTIEQIFEDRVVICEYCRECAPFLGEAGHKDQMSP